jgi:hypothetical protein
MMALKDNLKLDRADLIPSADDITKITNALTSLLAGLASAGPAATSLLASIVFLLIAATSAGAFRQPPSDKPPVQNSAAVGNGSNHGPVGHDTTPGHR